MTDTSKQEERIEQAARDNREREARDQRALFAAESNEREENGDG